MSSKKTLKFGLYQLHRPRARKEFRYTPPLAAPNDEVALNAFCEIAKTQPELQYSYLYCVGEFYPISGKIKIGVRRLVNSQENNKNEKA